MHFELSDDQRMLKDSVDRLIADRYAFEQRAAHVAEPDGWSRAVWNDIAELGLTALPFAEEHGGLGLGGVERMIVGEAFGRGMVVEPYLSSVVLAGTAIMQAGSDEQVARWLPGIITGETIAALAYDTTLKVSSDGHYWLLTGWARQVLGGSRADLFVLAVKDQLFIVPANAHGLTRRCYSLHGGGDAADLTLLGVRVDPLARMSGSPIGAIEAGIVYLAAEAVGAMQAALEMTVEYLKTREQFGRPIGANQALQHRAAEMLVEVEQARSAAMLAALLESETDADERAKGFAAVKAVIGTSGRFVAHNAVQLHGGIGVSEEHAISHYFRRLIAIGMLLGDTEAQIDRLAELGGFTSASPHLDG